METVYDWISIGIFGGLIVLFLERSSASEPTDQLWQYLPPAVGCATANYAGNHGEALLAILILAATLVYIYLVLKPFKFQTRR